MGVRAARWVPEAGRMEVEILGSKRHNSESATFDEKYVFWQHVARFDADALLLGSGVGMVEVDAIGIGQGEVDRMGGGRCEEGTKSGSIGAWVCSRVLITSNGVTRGHERIPLAAETGWFARVACRRLPTLECVPPSPTQLRPRSPALSHPYYGYSGPYACHPDGRSPAPSCPPSSLPIPLRRRPADERSATHS